MAFFQYLKYGKSIACLNIDKKLQPNLVTHSEQKVRFFIGKNMLTAKWIWKKEQSYNPYNQTIIAKKSFKLNKFHQANIKITADSCYRLFINNQWVNDGPCRSWPEHYQYDEIDISTFLKYGKNEIKIVARYWGTGTFHNVCQQAGLLIELDVELIDGDVQTIISDGSWEIAKAQAWRQNTPKISIQMEPQEFYDARIEDNLEFSKAKILFEADKGPWKDLNPRNVALLTKEPSSFKSFHGANVVNISKDLNFCIPTSRLLHPDLIEANHNTSNACGFATILELKERSKIKFHVEGIQISIDGKSKKEHKFDLDVGKHLILAFVTIVTNHRKEKTIRFVDPPDHLVLTNPNDPNFENPWCWIDFSEFNFATDDLNWLNPPHQNDVQDYLTKVKNLQSHIKTIDEYKKTIGNKSKNIPFEEMFTEDFSWKFDSREVIISETNLIKNPKGLISDNAEFTIVTPSKNGDVELVYDLGEQNIGYYNFELIADEGVEIDIFGIEYISPEGKIQHTQDNRNGMRYITKSGSNKFTSLKRRSGRYIFITFRNQKSPMKIRHFQLIESTYPVNQIGDFVCSDEKLNKIWDISTRTLKLCMEDTFTDCPLYEQTLWVGDARNEAMFEFPVYGATDIAERCIKLAAQSLERFPIVGCQVPSAWSVLLPAWSFLWGISVWDYYFFTGDKKFLQEIWPWVIRNLEGAEKYLNNQNLFSIPAWNLFEWSDIDDEHDVVTHNNMLLIGAINAAVFCADILHDPDKKKWLQTYRKKLVKAINQLWDDDRKSYLDSIHKDGSLSISISQHTNFLAILYDIVEKQNHNSAIKNVFEPPENMVKVGSPFAMMYFYETLEKINHEDEIIESIYESYVPMLEAGATTVWEIFPSSSFRPGEFPTRSHCHAWSSAPIYFLNRIILGIKQTKVGGKEFEINPRLNGFNWAKGTVTTINGPLSVEWKVEKNKLTVNIKTPENVKTVFIKNETHEDLEIEINKN